MSFKEKNTLISILFLALLLGGLAGLKLLFFSDEHYRRLTQVLGKAEDSYVLLREQIDKSHQGRGTGAELMQTAREIGASLEEVRRIQQKAYFKVEGQDTQHIDALLEQFAALEKPLKHFSSVNAQQRQSLQELPRLIERLPTSARGSDTIKSKAQAQVDESFLYSQWHQERRRIKITSLTGKLLALSLKQPPEQAKLLNNIISHSRLIHRYKEFVEEDLAQFRSFDIKNAAGLILAQYYEIHRHRLQQSTYLMYCIYVLSALMLLLFSRLIYAIRSTARFLSNANIRLNKEIRRRHDADSEQKKQAAFLKTVLDNISDGVVVCNNRGELELFNKAAISIYERELKTIGFEHWAKQYQVYDKEGKRLLDKSQLPLYRALTIGMVKNAEVVIKAEDGRQKSLLINGRHLMNENGEKFGAVTCICDITERKKTEMEMRLAATAFEAHEAIMITDKDANIIRVNQCFSDITGYDCEEVIGKNPRILNSGVHDPLFYKRMWDSLAMHGYWQGEICNRKKNGEIYSEWMSISVVRDEYGQPSHYVSHFKDISESKDQQEKINRAADEERILAQLLQLSFKPVDDFLQQACKEVAMRKAWRKFSPRCGIFLSEHDGDEGILKLVAHHELQPELIVLCNKVPFGKCLCGSVAKTRKMHFQQCTEAGQEISFPGGEGYAHYNVPVIDGDTVLAVLVLYLEKSYRQQDDDINFLRKAANVLSLAISRKQAEKQARYLAYYDNLTSLPNRMLLIDRLEQAIASHKRKKRHAALLYVDIDRFKNINDSFGTAVGDVLLQEISDRFKKALRQEDTVARVCADEFIILLTDFVPFRESLVTEVQHIIAKLKRSIAEIDIDGHKLFVTMSVGIVIVTGEIDAAGMLIIQADTAMHQAKDNGRNSSQFFVAEMQRLANARAQMEKDLHVALEQGQMQVYYQPQINSQKQMIGAEALIRWNHPEKGFISPAEFIAVAEETGIIIEIGRFVLEDACRRILEWESIETLDHVAVNVSPVQFNRADFIDIIREIVVESGINPEKLMLELTEGVLVDNVEDIIVKMQQLKSLRINFSIDDFGTGYSSLAYLSRFPVDQLKIDKSFVDEIGISNNGQVIIETIIAMAGQLGFKLIAEGVETLTQQQYLKQNGCHNYQGYYYGKPVAGDEFLRKFGSL